MPRILSIVMLVGYFQAMSQKTLPAEEHLILSLGKVQLIEAIDYIERNYQINFSYKSNVPLHQEVDVIAEGNLQQILHSLFENTSVEYRVVGNKVALRLKRGNMKNYLSGRIVDRSKEPVSLAHVVLKNYPSDGTVADGQGNFKFLVDPARLEDTLVFSAVGYFKVAIPVRQFISANPRFIILTEQKVQLDIIVVSATAGNTPRQIVKKAIKNLKEKLPDSPFGTRFHYRDIILENDQFGHLLEAIVDVYDLNYRRWYSKNSVFMDFRAVRRSDDHREFRYRGGPKWRNYFTYNEGYDIQLNYDYYNEMRFRKRILDRSKLNYWRYQIIDTVEVENQPVLVIDALPKENVYRARLYVKEEDYTILRIETDYSFLLNKKHPFFGGYDQIPVILPHQFGPLINATDTTYTLDDSLKFVYEYQEVNDKMFLHQATKTAQASVYDISNDSLITTHRSVNELRSFSSIDSIPEKIRNPETKWKHYYWYGYDIMKQIRSYDHLSWDEFKPWSTQSLPKITEEEYRQNSLMHDKLNKKEKSKRGGKKYFKSKFEKWQYKQAAKLSYQVAAEISDLARKKKRIDSLFHYLNDTTPGVGLAVLADNKPVIEEFYGKADLNSGKDITRSTVFRMASIAKQFVAMAILLLEEAGQLSLQDNIRKHLPELPDYDEDIRIIHLLNNSSGLDDPITEEVWSGGGYASSTKTDWAHLTDQYALNELVRFGPELTVAPPGSLYNYNNAGYSLLVLIIERVSGHSIQDYCYKNIFSPLEMNDTYFETEAADRVENKAIGYMKQDDEFTPYEWKLSATGVLMSTMSDLYLWEANFERNQLGKKDPALINKMLEMNIEVDNGVEYGLGLFTFQYEGEKVFGHDGDALSYTTNMWMFPELGMSIILLSNISRQFHDSEKLTEKVASIMLE